MSLLRVAISGRANGGRTDFSFLPHPVVLSEPPVALSFDQSVAAPF
jgi:hypothetical protein